MPAAPFNLKPHCIHVIQFSLEAEASLIEAGYLLLSPKERQKADRFVFPLHRQRYILANSMLRRLLAQLTQRPAQEIELAYGPHGKPYLPESRIEFNLSHSDERALLGFAHQPIGVDIEKIKPIECLKLAQRFFASEELKHLETHAEAKQLEAFYRVWTLKEAVIKATGLGLSQGLDSFAVHPSGRLHSIEGSDPHTWQLHTEIEGDYAHAIASPHPFARLYYEPTDTL